MKAGQINPDNYRHEIALSRKVAGDALVGADRVGVEEFLGALDMADELLAEVERLRALAGES